MKLGPLETDEIKMLRFDFTSEAGPGATLSSPEVTCTTYEGVDPAPAVKIGAPTVVGSEVHQKVQGTLAGVTYKVRATVSDSDGLRHGITGYLEVVSG